MLLLITIKAKACLGWSLRMMFPSFWCWQLFFIYDFQDRDGPSYCKVSFKSFKNVSNAYLLFLYIKPCYSCSLWIQLWNYGSYWSSNGADNEVDHFCLECIWWTSKSRGSSHCLFFMNQKKWLKIQSRNWTNGKPQKGSQNIHLYLNSLDIRQSYCFLFRVLSLKHY